MRSECINIILGKLQHFTAHDQLQTTTLDHMDYISIDVNEYKLTDFMAKTSGN